MLGTGRSEVEKRRNHATAYRDEFIYSKKSLISCPQLLNCQSSSQSSIKGEKESRKMAQQNVIPAYHDVGTFINVS